MSETPHRGIVVLSPLLKLTTRDLGRFRAAGYIPVIGDPSHIKLVANLTEYDGNALTVAALKTCNVNTTRQMEFGALILKSLIAEATKETP